ncbi:nitrate reductase molybdenum cofactor assembly chaperone [Actinocatenispora sera]|uniref:Nitrate reductase molybdenum cofactor assembly chaperone n=1 Tax=Actinocatenispora sera TaxID=390989 RepID=A0A810LA81_9ACTN|nr:nitrate reductase molybdenum cofactor assembly chaperone [Actinocatenispora sera]BCJ32157.1 nitrate reductase molybdenum cofactor assembly chaperone [Actinocatenispora sera]
MTDRTRTVWQAVALLLCYPDRRLLELLPLLRDATAGIAPLGRFVATLGATPLAELQSSYVDTFDFRKRCCLYLTWYTDGDTRRRGGSLAALKRRYAEHGFAVADGELPDFLPAVCEFAAHAPDGVGLDLLVEYRAGLALLRLALADAGSPYADVLAALCDTLPGEQPADRAAALALARTGPPTETVGLDLQLQPYRKGPS